MITIYDIKPKFQQLLRPIVKILYNLGATPNHVTLFTCLATISYSVFLYLNINNPIVWFGLPIFLFFRMALNAIDGIMAKEFNMQSNIGAVLNELTDIISDSILFIAFLGFVFADPISISILILTSILTEVSGIYMQVLFKKRRYDGPLGKSDRAFVLGFCGLLIGFKGVNVDYLNLMFNIMIALTLYTSYNRIKNGFNQSVLE